MPTCGAAAAFACERLHVFPCLLLHPAAVVLAAAAAARLVWAAVVLAAAAAAARLVWAAVPVDGHIGFVQCCIVSG
jgi:hypothetical protein